MLASWRPYLLETLLGTKEIIESIFEAFDSDPKLGIIAPDHFGLVRGSIGWGYNFDEAKKFASWLGLELSINKKIDFPSGSMFWGRSEALEPLLRRKLSAEDFPVESGKLDGELGHIIERLYYFICEKSGYRWIKIGRPKLLENAGKIIFVENKDSLASLFEENQYGLLVANK
jgi:lipopolysaccharide biosynthesis protein